MGPHPCNGLNRAWLSHWLEVSTESLRELHVMRQEVEERVRGALGPQGTNWTKWQRNGAAEASMSPLKAAAIKGTWRNQDLDRARAKNWELEHIEEEVLGVTQRKNTSGQGQKRTSTQHLPDLEPSLEPQMATARGLNSKVPALTQELQQKMVLNMERDHVQSTESHQRVRAESWQSTMWVNGEGTAHRAQENHIEQEHLPINESREFFQSTEAPFLRRIGSGSLAPRLRLGSSGVTSDLLFTRRFNGNCLSTHSSGFYENSDLDSISSSCSSLCSDSSCHTSFSLMSPHRSLVMRPRSIDYTSERRKELQNGGVQPKRPISAGALEGLSLSSISMSRYDITQYNDRTTCNHTYPSTPPLCAIQQRRKAERYICKLALKYRCKPGVSNPLPDLGPPTPRTPASAFLYSECLNSCPPSPQINSLSSSLEDVRKTPKGSWGRFFSRVMLKKDSRNAASELNLQHCINSPKNSLQSPSLADGQLVRAKSFRDLLSVNRFKRSQRGLNKIW